MIYDYAIDNTSKEEAKEVEGNAIGGIEGGKPELFDAAPAQDLGGGLSWSITLLLVVE